jgi:aspartate carbamoyltransferase catalytic subunit
MRRHLLALQQLDATEITRLLDLAQRILDGPPRSEALRDHTIATLFYEPSTRTEISFELASGRLGATVVRCDVARSSVQKGELLVDTVQTLEALGAQAIVIRHPSAGAPHLASRWVRCAVINAGDGMHEHPTQGLLDLLTVRQHKGRIAGLNVAIVGDVLHSRVARSAVWGFTTLGAHVTLVGPPTLLPAWPTSDDRFPRAPHVTMISSVTKALEHADVVMALRMQRERQQCGYVPSLAEYTRYYAITPSALATARPDVLLLHPGPMNLGVELSADAAYGSQSGIHAQVTNGVAVRMAVLLWALSDADIHDRGTARRDTLDGRPVRDRAAAEIVQTVGER